MQTFPMKCATCDKVIGRRGRDHRRVWCSAICAGNDPREVRREAIQRLRLAGGSLAEVARAVGVTKQAVSVSLKVNGDPLKSA
jgi:DNA invertase Pin-like site-specific DNA recombinase